MKGSKNNDLADRLRSLLTTKKNKLFASVLSSIEEETRSFNIDPKFFEQKNNAGFAKIRNKLLDNGNELTRITEFFVDFIQGYPEVKINGGVLDELEGRTKQVTTSGRTK